MAGKPLKTILVFEPQSGGHRAGFIRWLKAAAAEYPDCRFVFFTCDDAGDIQIETLGWWEKQKLLYRLFQQACRENQPDHVLVLELTHLELPLVLFGAPVPLSAILFVQYPELAPGLKRFSKHWKTRMLLWRTPVKNLFLLNGKKSSKWLQERFNPAVRFIPIPDPVPARLPDPDFSIKNHFKIDEGRIVFLFFGAISRRKGADILLEALLKIPSETAKRSAFVFCGSSEPDYTQDFRRQCLRVREIRKDIRLYTEERFVSDACMATLFEQSDIVLMPYTRPEYSSGILAQAAGARVPVIGPEGGLLGRLIRNNGLGIVCKTDSDSLAQTIDTSVQTLPTVDKDRCDVFVKKSRPEEFARRILDAVCNES